MIYTILALFVVSLADPGGHIVKTGMSPEQVATAWGKPEEVLPQGKIVRFYSNVSEVWRYEFADVFFERSGGDKEFVQRISTTRKYLRSTTD